MAQQIFSVSANARILVRHCTDRVIVTGWDNAQQVISDSPARQEGDTIIVEDVRRVTLRAPRSVSVSVSECQADVRIEDIAGHVELASLEGDVVLRGLARATLRDIEGDIAARGVAALQGEGTWEGDAALRDVETAEVADVQGDMTLNDAGSVTVQNLEGDLAVRGLRGPLRLGDVSGDISLHDVAGDVNVAHVDGDFIAAGVQGAIDAPEIDGDAVISLGDVKGVIVRAEGDAVVNFPAHANAEVELNAPHGDLIAFGDLRVTQREGNHVRGTLGQGGPRVVVESLHDDVIARLGGESARVDFGEEFREPFVDMGKELSQLGREIGDEVRRSVQSSLSGMDIHHGPPHARAEHRRAREERRRKREELLRAREEQGPVVETKPSGPSAGSPERKALLDAIARGELSVDDAIRKINGD